jgi:hypothetical protein
MGRECGFHAYLYFTALEISKTMFGYESEALIA